MLRNLMQLDSLPDTGRGGRFESVRAPPYLSGDRAALVCETGYEKPKESLSEVVSIAGALSWQPPRIDCLPISELKTLPETGPGGKFKCDSHPPYHYGDVAALECDAGFKTSSNVLSRVVVENGALVWDPPVIRCRPVSCPAPEIPLHGSVTNRNFHFPKSFRYACEDGHRPNVPPVEHWCTASGEWFPPVPPDFRCDPVECPELPAPPHGSVSMTDRFFGSLATFRCDRNYAMLRGEGTRRCLGDGKWSGEEVVCDALPCPPMSPPVKVVFSNNLFNVVDCGGGKILNVKCNPNGEWNYMPPYCDAVINPHPPDVLPRRVSMDPPLLPPSPPVVFPKGVSKEASPDGDPRDVPLDPAADPGQHPSAPVASSSSKPVGRGTNVVPRPVPEISSRPLKPIFRSEQKQNSVLYVLLIACLCFFVLSCWILKK